MTNYKDMTDGEVRRMLLGDDMKTLRTGQPSCLSPTFKYVSAANTDVAKTFARVRGQLILHLEPSQPSPLESLHAAQEMRQAIVRQAIRRAMRKDDDDRS